MKAAMQARIKARINEILTEAPVIGPDPQPCTCGAPRWDHTGAQATGKCERTGCTRYRADLIEQKARDVIEADGRKAIADVARWEWLKRQRKVAKRGAREPGQWSISASDLSSCARAIYYREVKPEGLIRLPEDKREARVGGMIHDGIEAARRGLYPWREFEVSMVIDGLDSTHRLDEYDPLTEVLEELKSAGRATWDYVGQHGPRLGALRQAMLYARQLILDGKPVRLIRLRYINRENGHEEVFEYEYDEALAEGALSTLIGYATVLDAGGILPRDVERTGPSSDPICARCAYRATCWNIPAAEARGRSPESYTLLGEDPQDETITWALATYDAGRSDESAGKKAKDQAKILLEGIPYGTYGEWHYGVSEPRYDDTGAYLRALKDNYVLPDGKRPSVEDIAMPKVIRPSVQVKRVRAATLQARTRKAKAAADETDGAA